MDTLELYRWAVQDPETHVEVLRIMYESVHPGLRPSVLREDFAGTAAESVAWVALQENRAAVAVDLDGETLQWARNRAERILGSDAAHIDFVEGDVMEIAPPRVQPADILSILNFSIFYLDSVERLSAYFAHARTCLASGGLLVLNAFGGVESRQVRTDAYQITPSPRLATESAIPPFEYVWEQRSYDPATERLDCRIHFNVPDPHKPGENRWIRDAFHYDWRMWSLGGLTDALRTAGFDHVAVWMHTYDASKGIDGVFLGPAALTDVEAMESWTAYVVATCSKHAD